MPRPSTPAATRTAAALFTLAAAAPALAQTIVAGPVFNPATGSRYYLLDAPSVAAAATWAQTNILGRVAEISDAAENEFIRAAFANTPEQRKVEIGLSDALTEGTYLWNNAPGGPTYRNWAPGEPGFSNSATADHVQMFADGLWYPRPDSFTNFVVVETTAPAQVPSEFADIAAAVDFFDGIGGATIDVAAGTYTLSQTVDLFAPFTIRGRGMGLTTINGGATAGRSFSAETLLPVVLQDLTLVQRQNVGVSMVSARVNASLTLRRVAMRLQPLGRALFVNGVVRVEQCVLSAGDFPFSNVGDADALTVVNTVISDFNSMGTSLNTGAADVSLVNCTIVGVRGARIWESAARMVNCVVADVPAGFFASNWDVSYTLAPFAVPGAGNIVGAPQFANPGANDFRLLPGSPGLDSASIAPYENAAGTFRDFLGSDRVVDLAGVPNTSPDAFGLDIGAFETPASLLPPPCVPDLNNDGELTFDDIQAFVAAFNAGC